MANFWGKLTGEISKLRDSVKTSVGGNASSAYKLDSSQVNYESARDLYYNTKDKYKLGSGFVKPVINTTVGFMGVPEFKSQDAKAEEVLYRFFKTNNSKMQKTHLNAVREGDCYIWITREENKELSLFPELETRLIYNIVPAEQVTDIILDPVTNEPTEYVLESLQEWENEKGEKKKCTIKQRIGIGYRDVELEGDHPLGLEVGRVDTPWDFIPIVHFKNESDETEKYGRSEIEVIEPYIKAYHDVMIHAMQGSKMHSTPKLRLKLKDVTAFLQNNLGVDDPVKFIKEGGKIDLSGNEMVILGQEDNAEFIEAKSATGDATVLLKFLFYCIVDASETPEFVFGVHTPSSQASVTEQMPVLIKKINRKRNGFSDSWQRMARIVLAMTSSAENTMYSTFDTDLVWEQIDPRSGEEIANETKTLIEGLVLAYGKDLISQEAAVKRLAEVVETMNEYEATEEGTVGEKDRIIKSKLDRMRMGDTEYLEKQLKHIDNKLNSSGV